MHSNMQSGTAAGLSAAYAFLPQFGNAMPLVFHLDLSSTLTMYVWLQAQDAAGDAAGSAKSATGDVSGSAKSAGGDVAQSAKSAVGDVKGAAQSAGRQVDQATPDLSANPFDDILGKASCFLLFLYYLSCSSCEWLVW